MIIQNGGLLAQGSQFSLDDVEVVTATCDIEEVRSFRCEPSRGYQAIEARQYLRIDVEFALSRPGSILDTKIRPSQPREPRFHAPEEEIALGPACWLWDYLRRSRQAGFFLPLSGGIDSASSAVIVHSMCRLVVNAVQSGNVQVIKDVQNVCAEVDWLPSTPEELCGRLFHTCYMGTEKNSSKETRKRAKDLGKEYDCSSADLNPIGGISKTDLRKFVAWAKINFNLPVLDEFIQAIPTAELVPFSESYTQSDEEEMGLTYEELSIFGRLRKVSKLGPFGAWERLLHEWGHQMSPREIAEKVKTFFHFYGLNRHKMTTVTPAYHAEQYGPDDNRFDLRPFLYPYLSWPYKKIEETLKKHEDGSNERDAKED
ncbi:MAG: glutamine-dependent NAD(+) synthetase [Caeruleum heppii]|nr:MAG: glutamine-dependent NAD(+) synthetase [Caeruleum heppii]